MWYGSRGCSRAAPPSVSSVSRKPAQHQCIPFQPLQYTDGFLIDFPKKTKKPSVQNQTENVLKTGFKIHLIITYVTHFFLSWWDGFLWNCFQNNAIFRIPTYKVTSKVLKESQKHGDWLLWNTAIEITTVKYLAESLEWCQRSSTP